MRSSLFWRKDLYGFTDDLGKFFDGIELGLRRERNLLEIII